MKERRLELGLTVVDLVERSGVARSTWRELEAGARGRLTAPVGVKIDEALGWQRGEASAIFNEASADLVLSGGDSAGATYLAETKRPRRVDSTDDGGRWPLSYRAMLEGQMLATAERLANLADSPTWIDELLGAWQQLSQQDRDTFLRLIRLAAQARI